MSAPSTSTPAPTTAPAPAPSPDAAKGGDIAFSVGAHVVLVLWSLVVVLPMLWTLMTSFKTTREIFISPFSWPSSFNVSNYTAAWNTAGIGDYFLNTIVVVGCALFLVMLLGAMCAYVLARFEFPGSRIIYYVLLAGLMLPIFLAIVPLFFILQQLGIKDTLFGLIMTYVGFALPFTVFFLYSFFRTLPYEISEAAAIDGAGEWRTFFQVMLPMAKPGLASVAIMNFLGLWNQFVLPVALNTNQDNYVLSQGLARFTSDAGYAVDFGAMFAAVVITVAPVLLVYLLFQRQLQGSVAQGTMK
ncbi:carbohydrate ABC transporter permease [Aestuariimicrobium soli]|uniref:carbohydrate ABC transporter permease n=1 Tax=Aestuariimicrobium soli TaxID=2035834 RepID=UPI003EB7A260